jgi:non-ribosomal peptide synthetase component F
MRVICLYVFWHPGKYCFIDIPLRKKFIYGFDMIQKMISHYKQLLSELINNPNVSVGEIDYLKDEEKLIIEDKLKDDFAGYSDGKSIVDLFLSQVKKTPNNIAVVFGDKNITYSELDTLSNQFANYIINSHNVEVNDLVSVILKRSEWVIVCVIGILKSGAAYVPIEPDYPEKRKNYIIDDSQCKIIIDNDFITNFINEIDRLSPKLNDSIKILPESLCYVIYTSGTTGNPKGVMIEHRSLLNYLLSSSNYINGESNASGCFSHLSLSFDASITEIFLPLINGKRLILSSGIGLSIFEDSNLFKYAPYDFIKLTPSHISIFTSVLKSNSNKNLAAKYIIGGETLYNYHVEYFKVLNINALIVNEYGPTEATVGCCINEFNILSSSHSNESISIGLPIANTQIYILDENRKLLPKGANW